VTGHRPALPGIDVTLRTEILDVTDPRWVAFVHEHPDATPFHLPAWTRAVGDCYGLRTFALALVADDRVTTGLPVVETRSPLRRRTWVSLPFTDHCPPLIAERQAPWLWDAVRSSLVTEGVKRLELRCAVPGAHLEQVAVRHVLPLSSDPAAVHRGFHRSQVQRNIRRAEREGVTVREATTETDLTEIFYGLHLSTRRRQGVPVQPRRFFSSIWRHLLAPGLGHLLIAEHAGVPVAAAVFIRHNGTVIYKYGASDDAAWSVRPNHAIFWAAIQRACAAGDTTFDWGRTDLDNTGLRAFKAAWGSTEVPLAYSVIALDGAAPAGHDLGRGIPDRCAAAVIRRGPPWVCSAVGTALYRYTA
jgi:CelD/BcsL family acetyltransferase involved in cellulose biosynthesis